MVLGEILGWDIVIVLAVIALLFGGAKLPKLARSIGSAKGEFEKGLKEGDTAANEAKAAAPAETKAVEATASDALSPEAQIAQAEAAAAEAEAKAARAKADAARLAAEANKSEA